MSEPLVVDASAVVALVAPSGDLGDLVADACRGHHLVAPHVMPFEVANVLRRHEAGGLLDATQARLAHQDLLDLHVELWPYEGVAARVWQLRASVTAYDAAYVAVAEAVGGSLVTLDARLARSPGPACPFVVPQG